MSTSSLHLPIPNIGVLSKYAIQHESSDHGSALDAQHYSGYPTNSATIIMESRYDSHTVPIHLPEPTRRQATLKRQESECSAAKVEYELESFRSEPTSSPAGQVGENGRNQQLASTSTPMPLAPTTRLLTSQEKRSGNIQFLAICWCLYLIGWNDGTTGPLLPRIQEQYQVSPNIAT